MGAIELHLPHCSRRPPQSERAAAARRNLGRQGARAGARGHRGVGRSLFVVRLTLTAVRMKEDPGTLSLRVRRLAACRCSRWSSNGKNALVGGVLLALIEGLGIMLTKMLTPSPEQMQEMGLPQDTLEPPRDPNAPMLAPPPVPAAPAPSAESKSTSAFGGLFGGGAGSSVAAPGAAEEGRDHSGGRSGSRYGGRGGVEARS